MGTQIHPERFCISNIVNGFLKFPHKSGCNAVNHYILFMQFIGREIMGMYICSTAGFIQR